MNKSVFRASVTISRDFFEFISQFLLRNSESSPLVVTRLSIFSVSRLVTAATDRTLTPGPRRPVHRSRVSALYSCTPGATCTGLYSYRHCTAVHHPHTRRSYVVWWDAGGDVFEFIINCMSLLNIAHARHCPHRSRWLPWPGARIISTKTVTRAGDAEPTPIPSLGWKFIWRRLRRYFCVLWEIFICGVNTGQYVWQPPGPDTDKPDKTRINYTRHLCGRFWRGSG